MLLLKNYIGCWSATNNGAALLFSEELQRAPFGENKNHFVLYWTKWFLKRIF